METDDVVPLVVGTRLDQADGRLHKSLLPEKCLSKVVAGKDSATNTK